ncbi:MAG: hypothetical protein HYT86_05885, partial [candidate division NC10 bacterium]|nr:hypothetical protein [candidate division NC10 bacterium]
MPVPAVLFLDEIADGHPVGGKARGLARLLAAGFSVPAGFVAAPEATAEEIAAAYRRLGARRVAVRSSAEEEDAGRLSYAGQFETVLGVEGVEALRRAVERCRASASGPRVDGYREDAGPGLHRMWVIVQRMVEPEYAGVAFAGPDGALLVEGVAGLGDALVSGRSAPVALPPALRARVEGLARQAAEGLGGILDLEWAAEHDRLWLLQARPITAPLPAPLPARFRLWTAANLQEAIPRPLTPLSEEATRRNIQEVFRISFAFTGLPESDGPSLRLVRGWFYMSYSAMAATMSVLPGFRLENLLRMFGDGPDLAPRIAYRRGRRFPFWLRLPVILMRRAAWIWSVERRIGQAREAVDRFAEEVESAIASGAPDAGLAGLLASLPVRIHPALEAMSVATSIANGLLSALMGWAARRGKEGAAARAAAMAAAGEIESVRPVREVAALADWLRANPGRPDDHSEVQARLARVLEACGFRGENEAELAHSRWGERPRDLLRLARQMAAARAPSSPGPGDSGAAPAVRGLTGAFLRQAARRARVWQRRREATRADLVRMSAGIRRLLLEVGRRLCERGALGEVEDVFYLLRSEIETLLGGPAPPLSGVSVALRIRRRRDRHRRLLGWPPPPRLLAELPDGRLVPFAPEPASGEVLRGFGASPGRVTGRARVLREVGQGGDLRPGEVLVARTTDIGWTPLFRLAAAVVTEISAPTSHAAIVARELGLPSVVNVD